MAETWWSTVRGERKSRLAISAFRSPLATSEDLALARGQTGGVRLRRGPRASLDRADAAFAEASRHDGCSRARAESVELGEGAFESIDVPVGQCQRSLVRAAQALPRIGGVRPLACDLKRVGLRSALRALVEEPGALAPVGELADSPWGAALDSQLERGLGVR